MSKPVFPQAINEMGYDGISQRRLLAGMILGPVVAAVTSKPPKHEPTIETVRTIVQACVIFADELIKQTEET